MQQDPATKAQAPGGDDMIASVLESLVEDGTITSAQADAISQVITDAMPDMPGARPPPPVAIAAAQGRVLALDVSIRSIADACRRGPGAQEGSHAGRTG
jgi:hypothetical protein